MENTAANPNKQIFRFKFNPEFSMILNEFARLHRYDNRENFNIAWDEWCKKYDNDITNETRNLVNINYSGDVLSKMYKSARYYYRKKSEEKKETKQRRVYVSISSTILTSMDLTINDNKLSSTSPAELFIIFCKKYSNELVIEMRKLLSTSELTKDEILKKIKKTFKNRYFNIKKNM